MIEKTESIFNKVFDYKWILILFTIILTVMYYIKIDKNDNYSFVNSLLTEPEKATIDILKIFTMYGLLISVVTPICRYLSGLLIERYLGFLFSNERFDEFKTESILFEESANENNGVKYSIYLAHQKRKERNLTIRKLNLSLFILMILNWNKLTQFALINSLYIFLFFIILCLSFINGVKPQRDIDSITRLKR